ncbi:hypothetical protein AMTR_s00005p00162510 [Amborella trichopoda]|uniref:Uncharacterized protein n=1 Tax=Amborella trichopoda TaxID=13333 RepID=W1PI42_AMBTC|nr:hypothetical protein AMTR_s00005p00162510 [Amborella trichopoda]
MIRDGDNVGADGSHDDVGVDAHGSIDRDKISKDLAAQGDDVAHGSDVAYGGALVSFGYEDIVMINAVVMLYQEIWWFMAVLLLLGW